MSYIQNKKDIIKRMKQLTKNLNSKYFLKVLSITKQGEKENNTCVEFNYNVFKQLLQYKH